MIHEKKRRADGDGVSRLVSFAWPAEAEELINAHPAVEMT